MRFPTVPTALLLAVAAAAVSTDAAAQHRHRGDEERTPPTRRVTIEAYAGLAGFGTFLEQFFVENGFEPELVQRELTAERSFTAGGAIGVRRWKKTGFRLGATYTSSSFEFEDDSPVGVDGSDVEDLADFSAWVFSAQLVRFLFDADRRFAPYALAGITGTLWNLDDDSEGIAADEDSEFRWGGLGGIGFQFRLAERLALRFEAVGYAAGNPFDGEEAFHPVATDEVGRGITFDEPDQVRLGRLTLGLAYTFHRERGRRGR